MARKLNPPKPASRFESEGAGLDTLPAPQGQPQGGNARQELQERPQEGRKGQEVPPLPEDPVAATHGPLIEPEARPDPAMPDALVGGPPPPEPRLEGVKRLSLDIPASTHTRFKAACAATGRRMVSELTWWMEQRSAELEREAKRNRRR